MKKITAVILILSLAFILCGCRPSSNMFKVNAKVPLSSEEYPGTDYKEAVAGLYSAGFEQTRTHLIDGAGPDEMGKVESVVIDGQDDFKAGQKFRKGVSVMINYHGLISPQETREQMDGFDQATNSTVEIKGWSFAVPEYWKEQDDSLDAGYMATAETEGKVVGIEMRMMTAIDKKADFDYIEKNQDDIIYKYLDVNWMGAECLSAQPYENDSLKGMLFDFSFMLVTQNGNLPGRGKILIFPTDEGPMSMAFYQTDNSYRTYTEDFAKMLDAIAPVK